MNRQLAGGLKILNFFLGLVFDLILVLGSLRKVLVKVLVKFHLSVGPAFYLGLDLRLVMVLAWCLLNLCYLSDWF